MWPWEPGWRWPWETIPDATEALINGLIRLTVGGLMVLIGILVLLGFIKLPGGNLVRLLVGGGVVIVGFTFILGWLG